MSLKAGTRFGSYEVVSPLGSGGMGEVYRARDTKLQRDVALKLLPAAFGADADRLSRFTREAQVLAALNHPNIGAIYGVEESQTGPVLVLELVEGPTLADRVAQGPLPVDDAVAIAGQVADALEAAHEQGIIHRDLKPANIKLRPDGAAKVLDFGLAKSMSPAASSGATVTSPAMTTMGVVLGTAAYMAPEQARGLAVDKRADIWAFGVVLFEMLAGRRPFSGETTSEILAAIIKDQPSWPALPEDVPPGLRALLRRLLEKDPRRRLRDIGDARLNLEELQAGAAEAPSASGARLSPVVARAFPWALAALATAAAILFAARQPPHAPELAPLRFTLPITGESFERTGLPTISPDGRTVAFVKGGSLWVRPLDQLEPRQLAGTTGAQFPFWSPDSRQLAYLTATALWRVAVDGSPPIRVATSRFNKGGRTPGGVWLADDRIVFAPAATGSGLLAVPAQGGDFTVFYERDPKTEGDFHRPSVLPDGRSLLFVVDRVDTGADTIGALANGVRKDLLTLKGEVIDSPVYSPTGHILYHSEMTTPGIWAVPFSPDRLEITGKPFVVAPQGSYPTIGSDGTLIYCENALSGLSALVWLDIKSGAVTPALNERFPSLSQPRISPNGRLVAAVTQSPDWGTGVIVADLQRHTHIRIADRADGSSRPAWRDDRTVIYSSSVTPSRIVMRAADGSGSETELAAGMQPNVRNGMLVFTHLDAGRGGGLNYLRLPAGGPAGAAQLLQQRPEHEWEPALSPDATLLAYSSGDPGQSEVILRTFPTQTAQWQVSSNGGNWSTWSPKGDAIYYRDVPGQILRVEVSLRPQVTLGTPVIVKRPSSLIARVGFDVSADGSKLLMVQEVALDDQRPPSLAVVQNWFAAFRK